MLFVSRRHTWVIQRLVLEHFKSVQTVTQDVDTFMANTQALWAHIHYPQHLLLVIHV
jgi:hypothetical protein